MFKKRSLEKLDKKVLIENRREQVNLALKRFLNNKLALIGGIIVFLVIMIGLFASFIAPKDPYIMNSGLLLSSPSKEFIMGTDAYGRDIVSRIIFGARISVIVGLISTSISAFFGILFGGIAGYYYGRWIDNLIMRIMDSVLSFPPILLAIVLVAVLGPSTTNAMIAIGIVYIPIFARVIRSSVMANKNCEYVEAAKVMGKSSFKIIFGEIIPNCVAIIIVQATVTFANAIIIEAALSFIGLAAPPPNASWGKMLREAMEYIRAYPLLAVFPGVSISLTVLGFNLLGDGLRDVLDPRLRRSAS